ncbi:MAG: 50S ribosomal protein L10 [Geovibrio sp.]|uniref:50S ribosomal protein L10 n=1 Tax=Geovibrio ferrireducens TaxID=46201 RepID=UPI002247D039|nr:50S ribosomal protein L10 [Geovibrio ferrireducens]MCD8493127.1 50S ribosomal protein L10 [Geovibrio sp.]
MTREEKKQYVQQLTEEIKTSDALFLANYKGLTFPQLTAIRTAVKEKGSDFKVVKNTLVKIALHNNGIESLDETLKLCTACTIVNGDVAAVAKDMKKFAKDYDKFEIKGGYLDGNLLSGEDVNRLADLPSREVLLGRVLATMNAPASNFVSLLSNVPRSFLNVLNAIKDQKQS